MKLTATFPKTDERGRRATYEWSDGLVAEAPIGNTFRTLPHDLEHYIVEARLRHPYGFWSLVGQQAPFDSLTLVNGRWPKGKAEWFERVKRKHRDEMVQAEGFGIASLASGQRDIDRDWPAIRRKLTRGVVPSHFADVSRAQLLDVVDCHREVHARWDALSMGASMAVTWPPEDQVS